jgi:hypothetical protein
MAVKILFVMLNGGYVRNYEGVLRQLGAEGHSVHIAMELNRNKMNENLFGQRLCEENPAITMGRAAVPEPTVWSSAMQISRLLIDYLRYLDPRYRKATSLRDRARAIVPETFQPLVRLFDRLGSWPAGMAVRALRAAEYAAPPSAAVMSFLQEQRPDVLLLTPLVEPGSIQVDYIKCARRLGMPTALCVASWDNLTNKGMMRLPPDRVFVWNDAQRDEAVSLHGATSEQVVVTGAQIFDHWFDWQPSRTREEFCRMVGVDPARPFVLYLGSSRFIAPREAEFGNRWIAALRQSPDPLVADAGIVVRPHPSGGREWVALGLESWPHAVMWPPAAIDMLAPEFKHDFFDSLYHCSAVVGVNTSAQIEAAIVGKVVCTVQDPDFAHSQAGTLHYQHLVEGGLLQVAETLAEHTTQLGAILRDPEAQTERSRQFVASFVRPFGRDVPAGPRLVRAIVKLAAESPTPVVDGIGNRVARACLLPLAAFVAWLPERSPLWVYALRPFVSLAVQGWLIPYRIRHTRATIAKQAAIRAKERDRRNKDSEAIKAKQVAAREKERDRREKEKRRASTGPSVPFPFGDRRKLDDRRGRALSHLAQMRERIHWTVDARAKRVRVAWRKLSVQQVQAMGRRYTRETWRAFESVGKSLWRVARWVPKRINAATRPARRSAGRTLSVAVKSLRRAGRWAPKRIKSATRPAQRAAKAVAAKSRGARRAVGKVRGTK